jgi:hypothetical protein
VFDNPRLGRFMQTDPVGYKDDYDLYTYVGDDPMSHTDPQGTVLKLAVAVVKMAVKGENLYSTVQGIVENIETIASPSASSGEKALAALSIVMDVTSGINVKDVKNVGNAVKEGIAKLEGAADGARSGMKHTPAANRLGRERNREANNGEMVCPTCGKKMNDPQQSTKGKPVDRDAAVGDHVHAKSKGGDGATPKDMRNHETKCWQCNHEKGDQ